MANGDYLAVSQNKTVAFVVKEMDDGMGGQVRAQNRSTRGLRAVAKWCDRALAGHAQGEWEPVHTQRHRFFTGTFQKLRVWGFLKVMNVLLAYIFFAFR